MQNPKKGQQGGGFRIVYQILIAMFVIAAIPMAGLWYIGIYKAEQEWTANIYRNLVESTENVVKGVDDWTSMNLRALEQNANSPAILSMEKQQHDPVLKSMTDTYECVYLAFTVLPNGQNLGRSDGKPVKFYGDRDYFRQVLGGRAVGQQVLLGKTSGKPAFILARAIKSDGPKIKGVIAIAMTLEDLSKTVTRTRIGQTGFAILVDENNRLMAHGRGEVSSKLQDFSSHPALNRRNRFDQSSFVFQDGPKKIVAYTAKTKQGWTVIVQQDYKEAYAAANAAKRNGFILLGMTFLAVLCVAFLLASRLSTPIRNLTLIADEISRGNLKAEIFETSRNDEIGALARAIERMGVSLQMAFDRLRKR